MPPDRDLVEFIRANDEPPDPAVFARAARLSRSSFHGHVLDLE